MELQWKDTNIPTTIFVSGKKRHGKDLFSSQIRTQLLKLDRGDFCYEDTRDVRTRGIRISRINFADPIKQFAKLAFGLDENQVNGSTKDKETPLPFWNMLTPREIMQQIGSNLRAIDDEVFAKSLIERMRVRREKAAYNARNQSAHMRKPNQVFICADCRFPNEVTTTRKHLSNAVYIRIIRPGVPSTPFDNHISEVALDGFSGWDNVVMNDDGVEALRSKANELVASWVGINVNNYAGVTL